MKCAPVALRASIDPLTWESQFFCINSGIVRFSDDAEPLSENALMGWSRVQAKIPAYRTDWLDALQALGFQLVEGEMDLSLAVNNVDDPQAERATERDISELKTMAAMLFSQSRFRTPWYAAEASGRFYAQWAENAVLGTFDHECLIFRDDIGHIRAFVTLRQLNASEARIGLLAGRGAGKVLMQAAVHWAARRGLSLLRVATQVSNTAAIKRYIQSGATVESTAWWLYR